mgnify:CR=1 FL=1|jgi:hypothetical protein|tara:strand:+ start:202 stop:561 length:360 start_codon:yes stop_codon:yes gene_type:complete
MFETFFGCQSHFVRYDPSEGTQNCWLGFYDPRDSNFTKGKYTNQISEFSFHIVPVADAPENKAKCISTYSITSQNFTTPVGAPPPPSTQALSVKDHRLSFLTSSHLSGVNVPVATAKAK